MTLAVLRTDRSEQGEVEGPEPTTTLPRPQPEDRHAAGPAPHPSSPDSRPFLLASQKDVPSSHLSAHSFVSWAPQATQADSLPLGYSLPSYCPPTPSLAASMCQPNPRPCTSREQAHCYLMGQGTRWGVVPGGFRRRPRSVAHLCVQRTPPSPSVKWDRSRFLFSSPSSRFILCSRGSWTAHRAEPVQAPWGSTTLGPRLASFAPRICSFLPPLLPSPSPPSSLSASF